MSTFRTTARNTALSLALATCTLNPAFAANVSTDFDHNVNFRTYHTFSFYKVQAADPFWDQRIKDEVTADLAKAGYQRVEQGGDLTLSAIANVRNQQEYETFYNGLGGGGWGWGGWGGGWGGSQTVVRNVPVGTLLLDMYDSNTHQLVWRGRSTDSINNNPNKETKTLDKDIDKMLNGFPPKSKG